MWVLMLNDMRLPNVETTILVAKAKTDEAIVAFLKGETVEPYQDGQWHKSYRPGGPLEWFNPPTCERNMVRLPDRDGMMAQAATDAGEWWDENIAPLPMVGE